MGLNSRRRVEGGSVNQVSMGMLWEKSENDRTGNWMLPVKCQQAAWLFPPALWEKKGHLRLRHWRT
jgi:hypothetical protein